MSFLKNKKLHKILFRLFLGFSALFLGLGVFVLLKIFVLEDSALKKSTILAKINRETTIMCEDETSSLGSFFDSDHMQYTDIDQVPKVVQNAVVAAEDKNFYKHFGVDILAVMSAFVEGVMQGGFRRGGSTLTQQTVKNIIGSWERSFVRKFREMIAAVKLEQIYSKDQILEFYLNQFHVAGNGQGIVIAARYYFNKSVEELGLVEAAFIAGSVKGPSKYNPFIKYTQEKRDLAIKNASARKNYVLTRMLDQGMITKEDFDGAFKEKIPFNRGKFRSRQVAIADMIRSDLNRPEILASLGIDNINELAKLGLTVFTTINCDLQKSAQHKMQRNLARLETILKGFAIEKPESFKKLRHIDPNQYYFAKVKEIVAGKQPSIKLDLGYPQAELSYDALKLYALWLDLADGKGFKYHINSMLKKIKVGDVLYIEVMDYDSEKNLANVELRKYPVINGGFMALDKGRVRSVVTGFDTLGYNRALQAKRSPGSVFKLVTYLAGLQLGWNVLDRIENQRQVFNYQGQFYYPRTDHASPYSEVSMIWAGVLSENIASVYLGAHLLDKLSYQQFKQLLNFLDLAPKTGESTGGYQYRVSKKVGAANDMQGVLEHQLSKALKTIEADLVFSGNSQLYESIRKIWWGRGYRQELRNLYQNVEKVKPESEIDTRVEFIKNNLVRYRLQAKQFAEDWTFIKSRLEADGPQKLMAGRDTWKVIKRFRAMSGGQDRPALGYFYDPDEERFGSKVSTRQRVAGRFLNILDLQTIWGSSGFFTTSGIDQNSVLLEGILSVSHLSKLEQSILNYAKDVKQKSDAYGMVRFFENKDFRIALGLYYLKYLAKAMGVTSPMEAVLSFPLGSNVVSLAEVSKIYQTFTDGKTYRFYKHGPANQITFLKRIDDREGNVLYEPKEVKTQLVHQEYVDQTKEILRRIVTHGTGRRARGELFFTVDSGSGRQRNIRVPSFGKTGTTNDFTTSYFAGFVPYPVKANAPLDPSNSYVLAAYVGYDMNETMRNGRIRVYGGTGALPLWTDVAKDLLKVDEYKKYLTAYPAATNSGEWPLKFRSGTSSINVDLPRGGILGGSGNQAESFATTDISQEGEQYENEFALTAGVRAGLHLPMEKNLFTGRTVFKKVGFFNADALAKIKEYRLYRKERAALRKLARQKAKAAQEEELQKQADDVKNPDEIDKDTESELGLPVEPTKVDD